MIKFRTKIQIEIRILKYLLFVLIFMGSFFVTEAQITIFESDSAKLGKNKVPAKLTIGGAIRLNYAWQTYNQEVKERGGDFGFEVFIINFDGVYGDLYFSIQYRWYEYFNAIHHGFIGYRFTPELHLQVGVHQVPFGILPYASHSFWFGGTYYLGFEDDYDTGIKLLYKKNQWDLQAAFYKNPEYIDPSRLGRYSFDLVTKDEQANQEINQFNFRAAYDLLPVSDMVLNLGASTEFGWIYNQTTRNKGFRYAAALHANMEYRGWNVQIEGIYYNFNPLNPAEVDDRTIQFGAFMAPFLVAVESKLLTFNVAKTFSPGWRLIDKISIYNDFTIVAPSGNNTHNSIQNVTGCLIVKKGLFLYVDWISGQNMWFCGGPGIGLNEPGADEWKGRININFGYYFSSNCCR